MTFIIIKWPFGFKISYNINEKAELYDVLNSKKTFICNNPMIKQ